MVIDSLLWRWHIISIALESGRGISSETCRLDDVPTPNDLTSSPETLFVLTHWGRVTHKCVSKLTIIGSDNGLSPDQRQAIIWTNAGLLSIGPLGTNFSEILIEILTFSFKKMRLKVSFVKWRPFCIGLNVLTDMCSFEVSFLWRIYTYEMLVSPWQCPDYCAWCVLTTESISVAVK